MPSTSCIEPMLLPKKWSPCFTVSQVNDKNKKS
jgi:hypothetical protein